MTEDDLKEREELLEEYRQVIPNNGKTFLVPEKTGTRDDGTTYTMDRSVCFGDPEDMSEQWSYDQCYYEVADRLFATAPEWEARAIREIRAYRGALECLNETATQEIDIAEVNIKTLREALRGMIKMCDGMADNNGWTHDYSDTEAYDIAEKVLEKFDD